LPWHLLTHLQDATDDLFHQSSCPLGSDAIDPLRLGSSFCDERSALHLGLSEARSR